MEQNKKYSAKEAALAVLRKAEELLKKSEVMKKAEAQPDASKNSIEEQPAPSKNPDEQKEGNNQGPGVIPHNEGENYKGYIKLARFMGHIDSKRKKKDQSNG